MNAEDGERGEIGRPSDQALTWLGGPWTPAAKAQGTLGAKDFSRMIGLIPLVPLLNKLQS